MTRIRSTMAAIASTCLAMGILSCGSSLPPDTIVQVGNQAITKAALDHWTRIEAVLAYDPDPTRPVPAGVVPDPPLYTACTRYLKRVKPAARAANITVIKRECEERYRHAREHVLNILITFRWMLQEGKKWNIYVPDRDAQRQLLEIKRAQFEGSEVKFDDYLKNTGLTLSDELLRIKENRISAELRQRLMTAKEASGEGMEGVEVYLREMPRRWTAKTSCHKGYVIPECKEYKGPLPPEASI